MIRYFVILFLLLILIIFSFYFGYDFCKYCHKTDTIDAIDALNSIKLKFLRCRYELYTNGQFHDKSIDNNGRMFAEGLREAERMVDDKILEIRGWK